MARNIFIFFNIFLKNHLKSFIYAGFSGKKNYKKVKKTVIKGPYTPDHRLTGSRK